MAIEAVIFDLYGTLVDIWTDENDLSVYFAMCKFLRYYGVFYKPEELAARYQECAAAHLLDHPGPYGEIDVFLVFEDILLEGLRKSPERTMVIWLARLFRSLTTYRMALYSDALPALQGLSIKYRLGLVSDAQWVFSEPEINFLGLEKFLETTVLSSRYFVRKPAPQIYSHALRGMKLQPSQALYVGNDPRRDVPGPQAIGMPVAIIHREGPPPQTKVPIINNLQEIQNIIDNYPGIHTP
jgi:putative hydrolase of the HAD superfamily